MPSPMPPPAQTSLAALLSAASTTGDATITATPPSGPAFSLPVHRAVLAAALPSLRGPSPLRITLPTPADLSLFVSAAYGDITSLSPPVLESLLLYGKLGPLGPALDALASAPLSTTLSPPPSWGPETTGAARRSLRLHFAALSRTPAWAALPAPSVEAVLRQNDLVLPCGEVDVFKALLTWLRAAPARRDAAVRLLRFVRFPAMRDRDLLRAVRVPDFGGVDAFYRMVLEAFVRRAEARLVWAPRNDLRRAGRAGAVRYGSGVGVARLVARRAPGEVVDTAKINGRSVRTAAWHGDFPLPFYRHMRFRERSPCGLVFTAVVPGWSTITTRVRTEARVFRDAMWSVWVDPGVGGEGEEYVGMYLCCEGLGGGSVEVDYSLFIASSSDGFVMERKICPAKRFEETGQASGFRLHTKRALVMADGAGLWDREKDELVVGAHVVVPEASVTASLAALGGEKHGASDRRDGASSWMTTDTPVGTAGVVLREKRQGGRRQSAAAEAHDPKHHVGQMRDHAYPDATTPTLKGSPLTGSSAGIGSMDRDSSVVSMSSPPPTPVARLRPAALGGWHPDADPETRSSL